jgi:shikimate dehydrogenase
VPPRALSGATDVAAVIGMPVRHSLSPALFNAAFAATDLDWAFVAFEVDEAAMPSALEGARALGIRGLSVTMPGKEIAARLVDELTPDAETLGAVNSIRLDHGRLIGHNTDGPGFVDALRLDSQVEPEGRRVVVVGAGGAARAVIRSLAAAGAAEVGVVGRTRERVERAVALAGSAGRAVTEDAIADADVVVNATPVGMADRGDDGAIPFDPARLHPGQLVVDLVYHPLETALVRDARARGVEVVNGVGMLVHQAAHQFRSWTGIPAPIAAMRSAIEAALH